jgi:RNA polymerase sigma-B factor
MCPHTPSAGIEPSRLESPEDRELGYAQRSELTRLLFERIEQESDPCRLQELRQQVAELHLDVVHSLARRYRGRGESDEDLRQAGYIGLMKAVNGFTSERGTEFIRYAVPTITGEIKKYFRDCCWTIRPTRRVQELQATVTGMAQAAGNTLGREPTCQELADMLDVDSRVVGQALTAHQYYSPRSLDAPLDGVSDNPLGATLGAHDAGYDRAEEHVMLSSAVRAMSDRDREIISLRFFEDLTQREIAERIGVTQMQVSRLLTQIFSRLRQALEPHRSDPVSPPSDHPPHPTVTAAKRAAKHPAA